MANPVDPMDGVDRKLNVFALANGMDLERRGATRILGWYRDGLERRIRLEPGAGEGTWALRAEATRAARGRGAGARDARRDADSAVGTLEAALVPADLLARFAELLAGATDAANALRLEEGGAPR
jgi:hypothetical protein